MTYEVMEDGELCRCGGIIDKFRLLHPDIWDGKCYKCGKRFTIIHYEV